MPIGKWIQDRFPLAMISVVIESNECTIRHEVVKNGKRIKEENHTFKAFGGMLSPEAITHINTLRIQHRFTYVNTMLASINQGALATCSRGEFEKYKVDPSTVDTLCVNDAWSVYGYSEDILWTKSVFKEVGGIDFVFSPFLVLYNFFKNDLDTTRRLYVLGQRSSVTLCVMDDQRLYFGVYFILTDIADPDSDSMDGAETSSELDGLGETDDLEEALEPEKDDGSGESEDDALDDLISLDEELEEIGGLEDLDDDSELADFEEGGAGDTDDKKALLPEQKSSIDDFAKGMDMLNFIKNSLSEFYENPLYSSDFIEEVVFADSYGIAEDIITYIQETLLLNITIKQVNLAEVIAQMAKEEVARAV